MAPPEKFCLWILAVLLAGSLAGPGRARADELTALVLEASRAEMLMERRGEGDVLRAFGEHLRPFLGTDAGPAIFSLMRGLEILLAAEVGGSGRPDDRLPPLRAPRPMGPGEAFIVLSLAREHLARHAIRRPGPSQLRAALLGGRIGGASAAESDGILAMWEKGLGWDFIAEILEVDLAPVLRDLRAANRRLMGRPPAAREAEAGESPVRLTESGIVTGRGKAVKRYVAPPGGKKGIGEGILSGSGKLLAVPGPGISAGGKGGSAR